MKAAFRAKYVVFSGIVALMVYVLFHNERFLVVRTDPIWQHYEPFKWWLLPVVAENLVGRLPGDPRTPAISSLCQSSAG